MSINTTYKVIKLTTEELEVLMAGYCLKGSIRYNQPDEELEFTRYKCRKHLRSKRIRKGACSLYVSPLQKRLFVNLNPDDKIEDILEEVKTIIEES